MSGISSTLRAVVVDDTLLYRLIVSEAVAQLDGFDVVAKAENGQKGLQLIREHRPDLVLLDLEMPIMDGLTLLKTLKQELPDIVVIIISSISTPGGKATLDALQAGAFDFITKPAEQDASASKAELRRQLELKLATVRDRLTGGNGSKKLNGVQARPGSSAEMNPSSGERSVPKAHNGNEAAAASLNSCGRLARDAVKLRSFDVIGIGVSTGGPKTLSGLIPNLGPGLPPICMVQHMPGSFLTSLAERLNEQSALRVKEAEEGEKLARDTVYLAPGEVHMRIRSEGRAGYVELRTDAPENHCRPAVDYLFRSLASGFGKRALGAILTGMGADGAAGLLEMRGAGAFTMAQDESTSMVYGMPKQAVRMGAAAHQLPIDDIQELLRSVH
ncbi:MAG: chemotaxis-specific protein-glutamate methyltransferase CheB [Pseudomonadota bacterium]